MTIFTVFDTKTKTLFKQFKTKDSQHGPDYNKQDEMAHKLQNDLKKLFKLPNDRIGVHINIFSNANTKKVLF